MNKEDVYKSQGVAPGWDERTPLASGTHGHDRPSGMGLRRAPKAHPHSSLWHCPRKPASPAPALKARLIPRPRSTASTAMSKNGRRRYFSLLILQYPSDSSYEFLEATGSIPGAQTQVGTNGARARDLLVGLVRDDTQFSGRTDYSIGIAVFGLCGMTREIRKGESTLHRLQITEVPSLQFAAGNADKSIRTTRVGAFRFECILKFYAVATVLIS